MTIDEVKEYFDKDDSPYKNMSELCFALGITAQAAYSWKKQGYISWAQQYRIEKLTDGLLEADLKDPRLPKGNFK